jgi:integrase
VAVSPATVPSPAQVRVILAQVARIRPELAAFFGCLYYAARRSEEAVTLRRDDLILPARGRGTIILTAACPRTVSAWTSTGTPFEPRGLKHRPGGTIRVVPIPPVLVRMPAAPACVRDRAARQATLGPAWPPPRLPAAPMTCGTPPCRCG